MEVYCQKAVDCGTEANPTYETCHVEGNEDVRFFGFGVDAEKADKVDSEDCLKKGFATVVKEVDRQCDDAQVHCDTACPGGRLAGHRAGKWILVQECPGVTARAAEKGVQAVIISFTVFMCVGACASCAVFFTTMTSDQKKAAPLFLCGGFVATVLISSFCAAMVGLAMVTGEKHRIEGLVEDAAKDALCSYCEWWASWAC